MDEWPTGTQVCLDLVLGLAFSGEKCPTMQSINHVRCSSQKAIGIAIVSAVAMQN